MMKHVQQILNMSEEALLRLKAFLHGEHVGPSAYFSAGLDVGGGRTAGVETAAATAATPPAKASLEPPLSLKGETCLD
jgi:hypothetical protein